MKTLIALAALATSVIAGCTPDWAALGRRFAIEKAAVQYNCDKDKIKVVDEDIEKEKDNGSKWKLNVCGTERIIKDDGPAKRWNLVSEGGAPEKK
jgi:hypothetical protein